MINKKLQQYFEQTWCGNEYIKPLCIVSKNDNGQVLVDRLEKVYWFDEITRKIYEGINNKPSSVDGVFFVENSAYFVEFKTGFKKKITKENFDDTLAECPKTKRLCEDYKNWFFEMQRRKQKELSTSIKFKAIESYITLEKQILPMCDCAENGCKVKLIIVIDEKDDEDEYESDLWDLSGKYSPTNKVKCINCFKTISDSLQGYKGKRDKQSPPCDYFYDDIQVLSVKKFEKFLDGLSFGVINLPNSEFQPS